jgi:hypothetical protein
MLALLLLATLSGGSALATDLRAGTTMAEFRVTRAGYSLDAASLRRALFDSPDFSVREAATQVLARKAPEDAIPILVAALEIQEHLHTREAISIALLRFRHPLAQEQVTRFFVSERGIWKLVLAEALVEAGDPEALSYLRSLLGGTDPQLLDAATATTFRLVNGGFLAPSVLESWVLDALTNSVDVVRASNLELIPFLKKHGSLGPSLRALVCSRAVLDASPLVRGAAEKAISFKGFEVQCRPKTALPKWLGLPPFLSE